MSAITDTHRQRQMDGADFQKSARRVRSAGLITEPVYRTLLDMESNDEYAIAVLYAALGAMVAKDNPELRDIRAYLKSVVEEQLLRLILAYHLETTEESFGRVS